MVYPHTFRNEHSVTKTTTGIYGEYYAIMKQHKIKIQPKLLKILQYIDSNSNNIVNNLEETVQIKSISGEVKYMAELDKMIKLAERWLIKLGVKYECFHIGFQEIDGVKYRLPSIILATIGKDPSKKTVCAYNYVDVKRPIQKNWRVDPWALTKIDKRFYGNGVAGGKGNLIAWLSVIQAFKETGVTFPVNLKLIIQAMHYKDHQGLEQFLTVRRQDFLCNVNYIAVVDSEWIGNKYPCLTYGSVGILHFEVTMERGKHSKTDLKEEMLKLFDKICDDRERILIPKFNDIVEQITPDEEQIYEAIKDFEVEEIRDTLPEFKQEWDKVKLLMNFWRLPAILVDGIEECDCEKNDKSTIKRHFMVKIVPKQIIETSSDQILEHIHKCCKELNLENKVNVELLSATRPWIENIRSPNYRAARRATIQIYKDDPNLIREDRDMTSVSILKRIVDRSVVVIPIGDKDINCGGANESMPTKNYIEGIKLLAAYLMQIAIVSDETIT